MRFLVTGGAGFIGSNIARQLIEKGYFVRIIDNFATGRRENLHGIEDDIDLVEGDIRDFWTVIKATRGIDYILHEAALPSVPRSIDNPLTTTEVNINGTLNLLEAARYNNVRRMVYASSSSVYGDSPIMPKEETMKTMPKSPYAITKLAGEAYCMNFYQLYGLETVAIRYFNVFGPRQNPYSQYSAVIPIFVKLLKEEKRPTIHGDGLTSRDFTYIDNVVNANILACEKKDAAGNIFNIACNKAYTLNDLVTKLCDIMGVNVEPIHGPEKKGDVKHSLADISKAKSILHYDVSIDFDEGLKKVVEWYTREK